MEKHFVGLEDPNLRGIKVHELGSVEMDIFNAFHQEMSAKLNQLARDAAQGNLRRSGSDGHNQCESSAN